MMHEAASFSITVYVVDACSIPPKQSSILLCPQMLYEEMMITYCQQPQLSSVAFLSTNDHLALSHHWALLWLCSALSKAAKMSSSWEMTKETDKSYSENAGLRPKTNSTGWVWYLCCHLSHNNKNVNKTNSKLLRILKTWFCRSNCIKLRAKSTLQNCELCQRFGKPYFFSFKRKHGRNSLLFLMTLLPKGIGCVRAQTWPHCASVVELRFNLSRLLWSGLNAWNAIMTSSVLASVQLAK